MKTKEILLELIELLESFEEVVGDSKMMTLESFLSYAVSMHKSEQEDVNPNAQMRLISPVCLALFIVMVEDIPRKPCK